MADYTSLLYRPAINAATAAAAGIPPNWPLSSNLLAARLSRKSKYFFSLSLCMPNVHCVEAPFPNLHRGLLKCCTHSIDHVGSHVKEKMQIMDLDEND